MAMDESTESSKELDMLEQEINKIIDEYETEGKKRLHYGSLLSSAFYLMVIVVIGIPIWYHTTTPERWPLPDISWLMVRSQTLSHYYKVSVVFLEPPPPKIDDIQLRQYLQGNHARRISFDNSLSFVNDWVIRSATGQELTELGSDLDHQRPDILEEIDRRLAVDRIQTSSIFFYVLPRNVRAKQLITPGKYRAYFIDSNHIDSSCQDDDDPVSCLAEKINQKVETVQFLVEKFYSHQSGDHEQNMILLMARDFDFLFDIIYEEDETTTTDAEERKSRHRNWIEKIDQLIQRFYTFRFNFTYYFRINFITQVLHSMFPNENFISEKILNETGPERLLPVSAVQTILNRIESGRVEHDNEKSYHLVLYIKSPSATPLKFFDPETKKKSQLITTPFRGSILIVNDHEQELISNFRKLVRTFFCLPPTNIGYSEEFFTQLEIESIVHGLVQRHIMETLKSLESIEKLLNTVSNMVIEKKIAERIANAMDQSMKAADALKSEPDIREAYKNSWNGYSASEKAFFDPSLLSLLYFPDDQKYAIYLPLFLPIAIPLIHNLRYLIGIFIGNRRRSTTST